MKSLRILTLSNCPLVDSQGSGYVILNFAERLRQRGHRIELHGPESYEKWPWLKRGKSYRQAWGMRQFVMKKLSTGDYDVVQFYGGEAWWATASLAQRPGRRYLVLHHSNGLEPYCLERMRKYAGSIQPDGSSARWYQRDQSGLFREAFIQADALITVSHAERNFALSQHYQDDAHVLALPNALPDFLLGQTPPQARPNALGFCGPWNPRKGSRLMARDLTETLRKFPEWTLTLIGVGDGFKPGDVFPEDLVARIRIIPYVSDRQSLMVLYRSLSVLVAPSLYESFGLVVAEAMASGCAVVTTKTGFADSLRDGEQVIHVSEPQSPQLQVALQRVMEDAALRLTVARGGYESVQHLRWAPTIERLEQALETWTEERCHGASDVSRMAS